MRPALSVFLICVEIIAAPFRNLGFEEANTNSVTVDPFNVGDRFGLTENLLPGWEVFQGRDLQTSIGFNRAGLPFLDTGGATLTSSALEGRYALRLEIPGGRPDPFSLKQRGDIPADARYLVLSHGNFAPIVRIDGVTLFEPAATLFFRSPLKVDIFQFAGKNVELEFSTARLGSGSYVLDNIFFVVPEPSMTVLLILGSSALIATRLWPRRSGRREKNAN